MKRIAKSNYFTDDVNGESIIYEKIDGRYSMASLTAADVIDYAISYLETYQPMYEEMLDYKILKQMKKYLWFMHFKFHDPK